MIVLEVGLNHLGSERNARYYIDYFIKSKFKYITFQIHNSKYYKINPFLKLSKNFYKNAIQLIHKNKKKIGLAVCDLNSCEEIASLNFDFFKLLSIGINNKKLIKFLNSKNKSVFISTGKGTESKIVNCLNNFKTNKKLTLLHTSLSYSSDDLNLNRINFLKGRFRFNVGYSHHYKRDLPLFLSLCYGINYLFMYIKKPTRNRKKLTYPDDQHAISTDKLESFLDQYNYVKKLLGSKNKINTKIKIKTKYKTK